MDLIYFTADCMGALTYYLPCLADGPSDVGLREFTNLTTHYCLRCIKDVDVNSIRFFLLATTNIDLSGTEKLNCTHVSCLVFLHVKTRQPPPPALPLLPLLQLQPIIPTNRPL